MLPTLQNYGDVWVYAYYLRHVGGLSMLRLRPVSGPSPSSLILRSTVIMVASPSIRAYRASATVFHLSFTPVTHEAKFCPEIREASTLQLLPAAACVTASLQGSLT